MFGKAGVEPTCSGPQSKEISTGSNGRNEEIRTLDPLIPNQVRYQAAPRPDMIGLMSFLSQPSFNNIPKVLVEYEEISIGFMVESTGDDPATSCLPDKCSPN